MERLSNKNTQNNTFEIGELSLQYLIRNIHNFEIEDVIRDEEIATVAKMIGKIATLERQNSGSQDFYDV